MKKEELITVEQFCLHYKIETSFIESLKESGLIEIVSIERKQYLPTHQIGDIEKMIRLHYDLDINIEGLEAITHLLKKMRDLQQEVKMH